MPRFLARASPRFSVLITRVRGRCNRESTSRVFASVEPSSMTITASTARLCSSALSTAASTKSPRLKQGMTTLTLVMRGRADLRFHFVVVVQQPPDVDLLAQDNRQRVGPVQLVVGAKHFP